jgi:hypothetical protein
MQANSFEGQLNLYLSNYFQVFLCYLPSSSSDPPSSQFFQSITHKSMFSHYLKNLLGSTSFLRQRTLHILPINYHYKPISPTSSILFFIISSKYNLFIFPPRILTPSTSTNLYLLKYYNKKKSRFLLRPFIFLGKACTSLKYFFKSIKYNQLRSGNIQLVHYNSSSNEVYTSILSIS